MIDITKHIISILIMYYPIIILSFHYLVLLFIITLIFYFILLIGYHHFIQYLYSILFYFMMTNIYLFNNIRLCWFETLIKLYYRIIDFIKSKKIYKFQCRILMTLYDKIIKKRNCLPAPTKAISLLNNLLNISKQHKNHIVLFSILLLLKCDYKFYLFYSTR